MGFEVEAFDGQNDIQGEIIIKLSKRLVVMRCQKRFMPLLELLRIELRQLARCSLGRGYRRIG